MKRIYFLSIVMAGLLSVSSCSEDRVKLTQTDVNGNEVITDVVVTADDFMPLTRTSISNELVFNWAKNDRMGVFPAHDPEDPAPSSQVLFTASAGGAGTATFNGSGWGLMSNRKYYAYYPYAASATDTLYKFTYKTAAIQTANNQTAHLGPNDLMYTSASTPAEGNVAQFQFHHLSSISKFEITVPEDCKTNKFTKAVIECADTIFPQVVSFNPTTDNPVVNVEKCFDKFTLTLGSNGSGFAPVDGKLSLWIMTGAVDFSGKTLTITLYDTYNKLTGTVQGANLKAGKAHKYEVTVTKAARVDSDYYVDLGLPSGKKWAVSNLTMKGLPLVNTVLGDYYGWGELEPYYTASALSGTKLNATWKDGYSKGYDKENYNKGETINGTYTSNTDLLSADDDAAHQALGGNWYMPTMADVDELFNNCTFAGSTINGVVGILATSKINGKTVFFAINGYIEGNSDVSGYTSGSQGARFWLRECADAETAFQLMIHKSDNHKDYDTAKKKWRGTPIRPIYIPND